jgi:tetratricopeptide (TPR) repeat protein
LWPDQPFLVQHSSSNVNLGQRFSRPQLLERASLALRMQRFAEAEQLASELLRASRTDRAGLVILARALLAQNRAEEAVAPLERAARRGADAEIETLLGASLGGVGRGADAIDQLRQAITRRPVFLPAFHELAGQLARSGEVDDAIGVLDDALKIAPGSAHVQLDLARLHMLRNERQRARVLLAAAREAAPANSDVLIELARVMLLDGEYAGAADVYRQALAQRPDDSLTRAELAAALLELGDRGAGEATLQAVFRGRPQMFGRSTHAMAASSHGRFFFRPSAAARFLKGEAG